MKTETPSVRELISGVFSETEWLQAVGEKNFESYRNFCSDMGTASVEGLHINRRGPNGFTTYFLEQRKGKLVAVPEDLKGPPLELTGSDARFVGFSMESFIEGLRSTNGFVSKDLPPELSAWFYMVGIREIAGVTVTWLLLKPNIVPKDTPAVRLAIKEISRAGSPTIVSSWWPDEFFGTKSQENRSLVLLPVPSCSLLFRLSPSSFCNLSFGMKFGDVLPLLNDRHMVIDGSQMEIYLFQVKIKIRPIDFPLVSFLARNPQKVFRSKDLLDRTEVKSERDAATFVRQMRANISTSIEAAFLGDPEAIARAKAIFPESRGGASIDLAPERIFFWS